MKIRLTADLYTYRKGDILDDRHGTPPHVVARAMALRCCERLDLPQEKPLPVAKKKPTPSPKKAKEPTHAALRTKKPKRKYTRRKK